MPSEAVTRLKEERERLREEHLAGASGLSVVRALSDATDDAVRSIWEGLEETAGAALVAVGGYGRGELSPFSDIDLIVIHPKPPKVTAALKRLSYELWDSGLEFAQAIYSPKEAVKLANERFDVEASFLSARLVAGDSDTFENFMRSLGNRKEALTGRRIRSAVREWRRRGGDAGADLEPNVKEGRGGLRDLGFARTVAAESGIDLEPSVDFLHRVRNQLHFMTGRRTDTLAMQLQSEVARVLKPIPPEWAPSELSAESELLRNLYFACREIGGLVDWSLGESPESANRFLAAAGLERATPWSERMRAEFLALLSDERNLWEAFSRLGPALLSSFREWSYVFCLPQRNVYHRYAVDAHSIEAVATAARLQESSEEIVRKVAAETQDLKETLLLASLLHDIGKGAGGVDHAIEGERLAKDAVGTIGLEDPASSDIPWLVRHHLLLAEAATRRDIGDERLVVELAEKVENERRLRLLFLLTVADGLATGPAAWGPWKATLVSQLFTHVAHLLERGELVGKDTSHLAHEREDKLREVLSSFPTDAVDRHLSNMPRAWLLSADVAALAEQSRMMLDPPPKEDVILNAVPETPEGIWKVTVVAHDRPGLFSKISGSLSLHGINVVSAEIYTREDGVALEVFRVETVGDEERRFERVREDAAKALRGRLSLDVRLAEKRKDYAGRVPKGKQEPPAVVVDNSASDFYTVIEVHATDRIGLLYTITKTLADMELDIHIAKISTYAEDVVDVFYVRDLDGQKVADDEHLDEIKKTILHRLTAES
jgi:[protein-PII] uridylyltransferase